MSIDVTVTQHLDAELKAIASKYPAAANRAARSAAFYVQSVCLKVYLSVQDGNAYKTKRRGGVDKRTIWPGLRRRTGTLARAVKVGIYNANGGFQTVNSTAGELGTKMIIGSAVGIGDEVLYGVIHERGGRQQSGRREHGRNFYPFLAPAFKDSEQMIEQIFDNEFQKAQRESK
jgi:hypothetical protein